MEDCLFNAESENWQDSTPLIKDFLFVFANNVGSVSAVVNTLLCFKVILLFCVIIPASAISIGKSTSIWFCKTNP